MSRQLRQEDVAFGHRLRRWRASAGISQEKLAATWGVSTRTISRWELGHATPGAEHADLIRERASLVAPPPDAPALVLSRDERIARLEDQVAQLWQAISPAPAHALRDRSTAADLSGEALAALDEDAGDAKPRRPESRPHGRPAE